MEADRGPTSIQSSALTKSLLEDIAAANSATKIERYQPLCFGSEAFNRQDFDVDEFIADCRRRVPLESVLNDLQEYSSSLQNELVQLINRDYASFVSLSTTLVGLDDVIGNLRLPLSHMKVRMQNVLACLDAYLQELNARLEEKRAVAAKKECLELFVHAYESLQKIETLLHIEEKKHHRVYSDEDELSDSDGRQGTKQIAEILMKADAETSKLIQRVANEFNQLKFYVSKGSQYPFIRKMEKRIAFIENSLQRGMEHLYKEGLNTKNTDIIANCLRTYSAIDRIAEAERMFRVHIVQPFMVQTITLQRLQKGRINSSEGLEDIYNDIIEWVKRECSLILEITSTSLCEFDFLTNGVMAEVITLIENVLAKIFLPAIPDVFYHNYTVTMRFIASMEKFANNRVMLQSFRENTQFKKFKKKWDINSTWYFQLRFHEIAKLLDNSLHTIADKLAPPASPSDFVLPTTKTLWQCLQNCWTSGIFIPQLAHRFFKLSLQLLSRYEGWLSTQLNPKQPLSPAPSTPALSGTGETTPLSPVLSSRLIAHTDLLYVHHDLELLLQLMTKEYIPLVKTANAELPDNLQAILEEGIRESVEGVARQAKGVGSSICAMIAQQCLYNLQPMRNIPQMYRMTNKPMPTRFCYYVPRILSPLETFLNEQAPYISIPNRITWSHCVIESVTNKFYEMSTDLLETLYKMEEYLKKRGKNEAQAGESDTAKIVRQLCLDVEKFGSFLPAHSTDTSFPPYQKLWKYVTSAEQALQAGNTNHA